MAACSSPGIFWSAMKPPRPVSRRGSSTRLMLRPIHLRLSWPAGAPSTGGGVMSVVIASRSRVRVGGAAGADTRGDGGGRAGVELAGGALHGVDDVLVASAAAEDAGDLLPDLLVGALAALLE